MEQRKARAQVPAREAQEAAPAAKRSKLARRLESCPGVAKASDSGLIMRPLPQIWGEVAKQELKQEPQPEQVPAIKHEEVPDFKVKYEADTSQQLERNVKFDLDATYTQYDMDNEDGKLHSLLSSRRNLEIHLF